MKSIHWIKLLLILSGLIAIFIGISILLDPVGFHAHSGLSLDNDATLLSEMRAPGGALLGLGVVIFLGSFIKSLEFTAIVMSTMVYLSYGFSRLVSMYLDGMPNENLLSATVIELLIGMTCLFFFYLKKVARV